MMKTRFIVTLSILGFIILISNLPPLRYLLDYIIDEKHYRYSDYNGEFSIIDRSGSNVDGLLMSFKDYSENNNLKDKNLYRLFYKNPLAFWRWYSYFSNDPRYELPYMNWNEIKKRRVKKNKNYQHF
jgi:hypothetical protein